MADLAAAEREARAEIEGLRADLEIAERCRRFELAEKQREVDCALANLARQAEEHTRERAADKARIAALERECDARQKLANSHLCPAIPALEAIIGQSPPGRMKRGHRQTK